MKLMVGKIMQFLLSITLALKVSFTLEVVKDVSTKCDLIKISYRC